MMTEEVQKPQVKKTGWVLVLIVLGLILLICFASQFSGGSSGGSTAIRATTRPTTHTVRYEVTSSHLRASLTYDNAQGNTEQRDVRLPWSLEYEARPGKFMYISAQTDHRGATISCRILIDGVVVEEANSQGDYVIASCSGRLSAAPGEGKLKRAVTKPPLDRAKTGQF